MTLKPCVERTIFSYRRRCLRHCSAVYQDIGYSPRQRVTTDRQIMDEVENRPDHDRHQDAKEGLLCGRNNQLHGHQKNMYSTILGLAVRHSCYRTGPWQGIFYYLSGERRSERGRDHHDPSKAQRQSQVLLRPKPMVLNVQLCNLSLV